MFSVKKDCFAYKKGRCSALKQIYCGKSECSFYKTKDELHKGMRENNSRLTSLGADIQVYIAETYYNGDIPWLR